MFRCFPIVLWAVVTLLVGSASADEAAKYQLGQQAGDNLSPDAAKSSSADRANSVAGLQCAVSLKQSVFRVGDPIEVNLQIQNVSKEKVTFYYPPDYRVGLLEFRNEKGEVLKKEMTGITEGWMHNKPYVTLQPGEAFRASFIGKSGFRLPRSKAVEPLPPLLAIDFRDDALRYELVHAGTFTVVLHMAADKEAAARAAKQGIDSLWQGDLSSKVVTFEVQAATRNELDAAIRDLREGTPAKKQQAIQLLAAHADRKAVPALVEILLNGSEETRPLAEAALSAIRDRSIVPDLLARYRKATSSNLRRSLLKIIESSSDWPASWPLYLEIARSDVSWDERQHAVSGLVDLRRPEVVPILVELAKSGDPIHERAAIDLIGTVLEAGRQKFDQELLSQLVTELLGILKNDKDATVRSRAAGALGHAPSPAVVSALIEALKDGDPWVGSYAAHTLGRIAGAEAIPGLEEYLAKVSHPSQQDAARKAIDAIRQRAKQ